MNRRSTKSFSEYIKRKIGADGEEEGYEKVYDAIPTKSTKEFKVTGVQIGFARLDTGIEYRYLLR